MIGALRHKIELLSATRVEDGAGGAAIVWLSGPEVWAEIERQTSVRDLAGDREKRLRRISAVIRFRTDLVLGQRLRFDGADYEVVSIESEGDGEKRLKLTCEEIA